VTFVANNPDLERRAKAVFDQIVDLPAPERAAAMERACEGNAAVLRRVESLLAANDHAENFIEPPPPLFGFELRADGRIQPTSDSDDPLIGQHVARYRILRRLASGGMGVVYLAQQDQPRRQVALKVMRAGLVSRSLLRRFEHEAELLGQLKHPGIAQVYEAGTFDLGRGAQPYFAMEFIDGRTLTDFAKTHELDTAQRLELLASVCDAVHYAHQKGIVHRDLKPDNILVEERDEETERRRNGVESSDAARTSSVRRSVSASWPRPKVLDFGVARLTDSDFAVTTLQTDMGQIVGTLPYMSPEQVSADPTQVDIRSDVYALGVIGFELLTGKVPLDVRHKSMAEAARIIVDHDPPSLTAFNRVFRGDLSTIIGKALEKDKTRRYQSAWELGEDLGRYLRHEPISARPATTVYQLRKFARRNKALVAGLAGVFLMLALGVIGTSIGMVKARESARIAKKQQSAAEASEAEAKKQREAALQTSRFLQQMLASINPVNAQGRDTSLLRDILDSASRRVEKELADQPDIAATLHGVIGRTYASIAEYDRAIPHLQIALDVRRRLFDDLSDAVIQATGDLGRALQNTTRLEEAQPLLTEALQSAQRLHGPSHPATIRAMIDLGSQRRSVGDYPEAERLLRSAREEADRLLPESDPVRMAAMAELANVLLARRKLSEANPLFERVLDMCLRTSSAKSLDTAIAEVNYGRILQEMHELATAADHYERGLEVFRSVLPPAHDRTISTLLNLASVELSQGEYGRAEELQNQAMQAARQAYGDEHPLIARILYAQSDLAAAREDEVEAERLCVQSLEMRRRTRPADHPDIALSLRQLARFRRSRDQGREALALFREALAIQQVHGESDYGACETILNLATYEYMFGDIAKAEGLVREAMDKLTRLLGEDHPGVASAWSRLALMLTEQERYNEALSWRRRVVAFDRANNRPDDRLGVSLREVGDLLNTLGRHAEAEPILRESLRRLQAFFGDDHVNVCRSMASLGESLTHLGQYEEAERLLLDADRLWSAAYPASPQTRTMRLQLAALYQAINKPEHAAHWEAAAESRRPTSSTTPSAARPQAPPTTQPDDVDASPDM